MPAYTPYNPGVSGYPAQRLRHAPMKMPWALPIAVVLTVLAPTLIVGGVFAYRSAGTNLKPTKITCAQFLKSPPTSGYYQITGCTVAVVESTYIRYKLASDTTPDSNSPPSPGTDIFMPVYSSTDEERTQTPLALVSDTEETRAITEEVHRVDTLDQKEIDKWVKDHLSELYVTRDIIGSIQSGFEVTSDTRAEIGRVSEGRLAPNFVVIREGATPFEAGPIATIVFGSVAAFFALAFWIMAAIHIGHTRG
jgi:hypothetical protein